MPSKPFKLRRWQLRNDDRPIYFYTCARPGRSSDPTSRHAHVPDSVVSRWILSLPGPKTVIISLLGAKPDGMSEYNFYSFSGGTDSSTDKQRSFEVWLRDQHPEQAIELVERPTIDFQAVPQETILKVLKDIKRLASQGNTVVLVDSGGETRTGAVCRRIGATEAFS